MATRRRGTAWAAALLIVMTTGVSAQTQNRIEGIPVPSSGSLGRSSAPASQNPGLRDDANSPIGPALGTAGTAPDGSMNPSSGTMANPSQ